MKKTILRTALAFLTASLALACVTDPASPSGPHVLGYSAGGCSLSCLRATPPDWQVWQLTRTPDGPDTFLVYGRYKDVQAGLLGTKTRLELSAGRPGHPILDVAARGGCLTFEQKTSDTVTISGKRVIVALPVEPCFPFSLHPTP